MDWNLYIESHRDDDKPAKKSTKWKSKEGAARDNHPELKDISPELLNEMFHESEEYTENTF